MKKILIFSIFALGTVSCSLDYSPSDAMTSNQIKNEPAAAVYATDGTYSMFKDCVEYNGTADTRSYYVRHFFQMSEFRGDNVCLSGRTEDPLYEAICYADNSTLLNNTYMWWIAYKIIYSANAMIESIPEGVDPVTDHIKGENYALRALAHLHLSLLYSYPYSHGRDNMGVVLRTSTECPKTERASVGAVYDQIEADLKDAIRLMSKTKRGSDNSYLSKTAAQGLLSRVYLEKGMYDECIAIVDEMLGGADPYSKLDQDYANIFANAQTSPEVLFCIAIEATESHGQGSLASMYYKPAGAKAWGEMYYSQPLIDLFGRYKDEEGHSIDKRFQAMAEMDRGTGNEGKTMIFWPVKRENDNFYENWIDRAPVKKGDKWTCKDSQGKVYEVEVEKVNGFDKYYIMYNGEKTYVTVTDYYLDRMTYPMMYMKKFSNQGGDSNLCSPIFIRWSEVILNRAEAYAKKGDEKALVDLNAIRKRAGIPEWKSLADCQAAGYPELIDVVLDERRLELCFEGFRANDMFRNKKDLDRKFAGVQPWEVVKWNDSRIPYKIPFDEISVSGIPQN